MTLVGKFTEWYFLLGVSPALRDEDGRLASSPQEMFRRPSFDNVVVTEEIFSVAGFSAHDLPQSLR